MVDAVGTTKYTYTAGNQLLTEDGPFASDILTNTNTHRLIQERTGANTPTVSYTRGTDLSGSLEWAGGIGGLLARSHGYSSSNGSWSTHNFYHADGNGNITRMINSSQSTVASYRYDPFGRIISQSGTLAGANVYRFSSKEWHQSSGLYYYGYRFYDPNLQRWLNRDPIGEQGGINLYEFLANNPITFWDPDGRSAWDRGKRAVGKTIAKPRKLCLDKSCDWDKCRHGQDVCLRKAGKRI